MAWFIASTHRPHSHQGNARGLFPTRRAVKAFAGEQDSVLQLGSRISAIGRMLAPAKCYMDYPLINFYPFVREGLNGVNGHFRRVHRHPAAKLSSFTQKDLALQIMKEDGTHISTPYSA
jgi:hypothetical protein